MTERVQPAPCYRDRDNGIRFVKNGHRHDCGDPACRGCTPCPEKRHCGGKRNCSWHLPEGVLTCGRCVGDARRELGWIADLSALVGVQAMTDGVTSEAANLAGPAADPRALAEWQVARKGYLRSLESLGRITEAQHLHALEVLSEDDDLHPYAVLTRWQMMLAEDYGHDLPGRLTIANAAAYLDRQLHRVANDEHQDFLLLKAELRDCRKHLETVLHNDEQRDRGAPCPTCRAAGRIERLERQYAHWCQDETCEKFHFTDDGSDVWRCPRDRSHWWTQQGYADVLAARRRA